jgi:NlpC/P60 family putative phage cell wall peptidase
METVQRIEDDPIVDAIITEARTWVGTPYVHQGRTKKFGTDCIGLLIGVMHEIGAIDQEGVDWVVREFGSYKRLPKGNSLARGVGQFMPEVMLTQKQPGDVILVSMDGLPRHCAIYTYDNTLIHAYLEAKKCVETRYAHYWKRMSLCAFRLSESYLIG